MLRVIAVGVALVASAAVAGAQATKASSKSTVHTTTVHKVGATRANSVKKAETQAQLRAEAKVSLATARAAALKEVPNGTIKSSELEREHGKLIYSFDISVPGKPGVEEIAVSAIDGSVVSREHETPKMEKKETAKAVKEKKDKK